MTLDVQDSRDQFTIGEPMGFNFSTSRDCYLLVFHISATGEMSVLFPNRFHKDNGVRKGQSFMIPPFEGGKFLFNYRVSGPPGQEMVKAIATREYIDPWSMDMTKLTGYFKEIDGDMIKASDTLFLSLNQMLRGSPPSTADRVSIPTGGEGPSGWATDSATFIISE